MSYTTLKNAVNQNWTHNADPLSLKYFIHCAIAQFWVYESIYITLQVLSLCLCLSLWMLCPNSVHFASWLCVCGLSLLNAVSQSSWFSQLTLCLFYFTLVSLIHLCIAWCNAVNHNRAPCGSCLVSMLHILPNCSTLNDMCQLSSPCTH